MRQYLLFDSGCATCSNLAQAIEREVDGELTARSLRDPEMQELLDRAEPEWQWEPTLLEVCDEVVRAYTGIRMGLRLVRTLGPRQAMRVMKLVGRHADRLTGPTDPSRRRWLRQSGSLFAALVMLLGSPRNLDSLGRTEDHPLQQTQSDQALQGPEGEQYEGFMLLPDIDTPLPSLVELAPVPILGRVSEQRDLAFVGETTYFSSPMELANNSSVPVYKPSTLPQDMQFMSGSTIQFAESGDLFQAILKFGSPNARLARIITLARPTYPRPYPVWPVRPPSRDKEQLIHPEKASFSPSPGILRYGPHEHKLQWIESNTLYTLITVDMSREAVEEIASTLTRV